MTTIESIPGCLRCGTCCKNGGPALHREDRRLIENGILSINDLFTIRKGEPVWDNVRNQRIFADDELIKIKGTGDTWSCKFYDQKDKTCGIYIHRPVECQVLNCRDTRKISQIYEKERLSRMDLLSERNVACSFVKDHELTCGYKRIKKLIQSIDDPSCSEQLSRLMEIVLYDAHLRDLLVEKKVLHEDAMAFFFGLPLMETIRRFGYKIEKGQGASYRICQV